MRALWVDAGNDPDWDKISGSGEKFTALYFDIREARLTKAYLDNVKSRGYVSGVYADEHWPEFDPDKNDPEGFAQQVHQRIQFISPNSGPSHPKVQFDMELKDPDYIGRVLTRWRQLRPYHDTSWTMEGGQGGWMGDPEFVSVILGVRVRLAPQLYNGAMTEVWDSLAYTRDLTRYGYLDSSISPFYDAAHLPVGWDGFAFTMGRLP